MSLGSTLREHGAQRPTVFEVLAHVHSLRGTKSAYKYPLPTPTPLSPRHSEFRSNPLDCVITYRQTASQSHLTNVQPVSKVQPPKPTELALTPERRGRPKPSAREKTSPSPSVPLKLPTHQPAVEKTKLIDDSDFGTDGNAAWSSAIARNTSMVTQDNTVNDEAWNIDSAPEVDKAARSSRLSSNTGFNDDFAQSLWTSAGSSTIKPLFPTPNPRLQSYSPKIGPLPHATLAPNGDLHKTKYEPQIRTNKERDAFEGLGLMTPVSKPAPTLGEARKLRTGLAIMSTNASRPIRPSPSPRIRPKAHTPRVSPIPPPRSLEPEASSWPSPKPVLERATSSAESRFPSLEELDATFSTPSSSSRGTPNKQDIKSMPHTSEPPALPSRPTKAGATGSGSNAGLLKPIPIGQVADGTRSEQVTGTVARVDYIRRPQDDLLPLGKHDLGRGDIRDSSSSSKSEGFNLPRPLYSRDNKDVPPPLVAASSSPPGTRTSPPGGLINHAARSKDLLTGDDEPELPLRRLFDSKLGQDIFKIRESPSKRASVIERNNILEATIPQQGHAPSPPAKELPITSEATPAPIAESPTVSRFVKTFPAIDTSVPSANHSSGLTENWSPITTTHLNDLTKGEGRKDNAAGDSSSEDEGPEEPIANSSIPLKLVTGSQPKRKGRQSSVHDLVDLWGGGVTNVKEKPLEPSVPAPFRQNTGATKPKPTYLPPPRASSPPRKSSPLVTGPQNHPPLALRNEQSLQGSAPSSPSPKSGRPRPQSVFIFPSKPNDGSSPPSATLLSPEDPKPRSRRRTSISDMVQHYEAIQASAKVSGNTTPSPVNLIKPVSLSSRDHVHDSASSRPAKSSLDKIAVALPGLGTPSAGTGDPIKRRTSLTVPSGRTAFSSQRISPVSPTAPKSVSRVEADADTENVPPRPRNASVIRTEPIKLPTPARKPVLTMEQITQQSQPDQSVSVPNANADRSPSPDRPYQGVGKLIDQWQRKSAEAEASRNAILSKRANLAPSKRAGLVPNAKGT